MTRLPDVSPGAGWSSIVEILFFDIMHISFALHPDQSHIELITKGHSIYGFMYLRHAGGISCILNGRAMIKGQI